MSVTRKTLLQLSSLDNIVVAADERFGTISGCDVQHQLHARRRVHAIALMDVLFLSTSSFAPAARMGEGFCLYTCVLVMVVLRHEVMIALPPPPAVQLLSTPCRCTLVTIHIFIQLHRYWLAYEHIRTHARVHMYILYSFPYTGADT